MVTIDREDDIFVLTMAAGENRWNTTFTRAFDAVLDEVDRSKGPAALVTVSDDEKFFSNGLDLEWVTSRGDHPGGDRKVFNSEVMALFARLITLPIPTVCAVNGHAFGAGFMIALCHDARVMNRDRGFLCANEVELGFAIPEPELALFRHKIPMPAFFQTVQLARRWTGPDALSAGIVQEAVEPADVRETALTMAGDL
ncbi:MAG: enoyl-CoA hydratase/isomerase family protein, partial [Actinomycetia bacterium]|nr:enoyl-CoA hydratase/isomerase family protein [Actinomycetes bacterium]